MLWRNVSKSITTSAQRKNEVKASDNETHFGFETVKSSEKAEKGKLFCNQPINSSPDLNSNNLCKYF